MGSMDIDDMVVNCEYFGGYEVLYLMICVLWCVMCMIFLDD